MQNTALLLSVVAAFEAGGWLEHYTALPALSVRRTPPDAKSHHTIDSPCLPTLKKYDCSTKTSSRTAAGLLYIRAHKTI